MQRRTNCLIKKYIYLTKLKISICWPFWIWSILQIFDKFIRFGYIQFIRFGCTWKYCKLKWDLRNTYMFHGILTLWCNTAPKHILTLPNIHDEAFLQKQLTNNKRYLISQRSTIDIWQKPIYSSVTPFKYFLLRYNQDYTIFFVTHFIPVLRFIYKAVTCFAEQNKWLVSIWNVTLGWNEMSSSRKVKQPPF